MEFLPRLAWSYDWSKIQPNTTYLYEDAYLLNLDNKTPEIMPLFVKSGPKKGLQAVTPSKDVPLKGLLNFKYGTTTLGGYTLIHAKQLDINAIISNLTSNITNYEASIRNAKTKLSIFQNLQTTNPEFFI